MINLSWAEAIDFYARTDEATAESKMLDLVMPNGKKLRDCTGDEVAEVGAALEKLDRERAID